MRSRPRPVRNRHRAATPPRPSHLQDPRPRPHLRPTALLPGHAAIAEAASLAAPGRSPGRARRLSRAHRLTAELPLVDQGRGSAVAASRGPAPVLAPLRSSAYPGSPHRKFTGPRRHPQETLTGRPTHCERDSLPRGGRRRWPAGRRRGPRRAGRPAPPGPRG